MNSHLWLLEVESLKKALADKDRRIVELEKALEEINSFDTTRYAQADPNKVGPMEEIVGPCATIARRVLFTPAKPHQEGPNAPPAS